MNNRAKGPEEDEDGYTESEYFAEMGFSLSERLAARARCEQEDEDSKSTPMLPCGHVSHEDGGPSDYGQECRRPS